MGTSLYICDKKTGRWIDLGRDYHYFEDVVLENIPKGALEEYIEETLSTIRETMMDILSDLFYCPKDYDDSQRAKTEVKNKLEYLEEESERLGKLRTLLSILEDENLELIRK